MYFQNNNCPFYCTHDRKGVIILNWVEVISTVGFPIAAFLILAFYIYKVQTDFRNVIEENTLAIMKLLDKLNTDANDAK